MRHRFRKYLLVLPILLATLACSDTAYFSFGNSDQIWSPDGEKIIYSYHPMFSKEYIYVLDLNTSLPHQLEQISFKDSEANHARYLAPIWSPKTDQIAFVAKHLYLVDTVTQATSQFPNLGNISNPVWSPNGKQIAFTSFQNSGRQVGMIDSDGKNLRWITRMPLKDISTAISWSPNGEYFSFGTRHKIYAINVIDSSTRTFNYPSESIAWLDDNSFVFISLSSVYRASLDNNEVSLIYPYDTLAIALSPDRKQLAIFNSQFDTVIIQSLVTNTRKAFSTNFPQNDNFHLAWSPNGQYLLLADQNQFWILDIPTQKIILNASSEWQNKFVERKKGLLENLLSFLGSTCWWSYILFFLISFAAIGIEIFRKLSPPPYIPPS